MVKHIQAIRLSVFDHFVGLALHGLIASILFIYIAMECARIAKLKQNIE